MVVSVVIGHFMYSLPERVCVYSLCLFVCVYPRRAVGKILFTILNVKYTQSSTVTNNTNK